MRRLTLLVAIAAACTPAAPPRAPLPTPPRHIEVQGHRGARAVLPEESLIAFDHALEVGADTLELDVAVSKDDALVVWHDLALDPARCLGPGGAKLEGHLPVRALTLAELQAFDCGSLPHERFPTQKQVPGTRIATLGEVFDLVARSKRPAARTVGFNIEMKGVPAHPERTLPAPELARRILEDARAHGLLGRVTIESFDHHMLREVKRQSPRTPIALLVEGTHPDFAALASNAGAEIVSPHHEWITADDVVALHARGVRVIPWTANRPEEWTYLVGIGVDGIISDDPAALIAWLRGRGLRP